MSRRTENEDVLKRYRRERKRIQGYLSRRKKEGYDISDYNLPAIPKRITEGSIRRLQKQTPDFINKNIYYVDKSTGEVFSGERRRSILKAKKEEYKERVINETIIEAFRDEIRELPYDYTKYKLLQYLNYTIEKVGIDIVAEALEEKAKKGQRFEVYDPYRTVEEGIRYLEEAIQAVGSSLDKVDESYIQDVIDELRWATDDIFWETMMNSDSEYY